MFRPRSNARGARHTKSEGITSQVENCTPGSERVRRPVCLGGEGK